MPLFGLKNTRKRVPSTLKNDPLCLRKTQSTGDIEDSVVIKVKRKKNQTVSILRGPNSTQRPNSPPLAPVIEDDFDDKLLASKLKDITACDMELLLSLETQARMDCQEEKEKKQHTRPSRIKFDLPMTPPRSKSPDRSTRQRRWSLPDDKKKPGRLTRWGKLMKQQEEAQNNKIIQQLDTSSEEDLISEQDDIVIGSKVKLFKRPLPIIGTVKFIGKVHFDTGEWLGIELSSRVGNTDGIMDGKRYFQTNLHCGIFVKKQDTIKV
ncbi:CAP Gly-rich domain-containing protein [Thamnidium elegans]|nr:CAP Gly-rich domain-containing protein [Thamnidium elegans]